MAAGGRDSTGWGVALVDEMEAPLAGLVLVDVGFLDVEVPAVQPQLAAGQPLPDDGVGLEVLELFEHVELRELVVALEVIPEARARLQLTETAGAMTEPAVEGRRIGMSLSLGEGADGAAFRVPADNDFGDRQEESPNWMAAASEPCCGARLLIGRNQVADVTDDEQIAGLGGGEQVRTTRLSEQAINRVSGRWPSASRAKVSLTVGRTFLRKSTMPLSSFFTVP